VLPVIVEVDRILRPNGKLIVRDDKETVDEIQVVAVGGQDDRLQEQGGNAVRKEDDVAAHGNRDQMTYQLAVVVSEHVRTEQVVRSTHLVLQDCNN
jgi:hypothetical protein